MIRTTRHRLTRSKTAMSIPNQLRSAAIAAFTNACVNYADGDNVTLKLFNRPLAQYADGADGLTVQYGKVIDAIGLGGLPLLLSHLIGKYPGNSIVQQAFAGLRRWSGSANLKLFDSHLLCQSHPFLNRSHLRMHVHNMLEKGTPRVLVVNGPPESGRSITHTFIQHAAQEHAATLYYLDMKETSARNPHGVGSLIGRGMNWDLTNLPPAGSKAEELPEQVAHWIRGHAEACGSDVILIIDNACNPTIDEATKELFYALAHTALTANKLRVVILGESFLFLTRSFPNFVAHELVPQMTLEDLRSFTSSHLQYIGCSANEDDVFAIATTAFNEIEQPDGTYRAASFADAATAIMDMLHNSTTTAPSADWPTALRGVILPSWK